MCFLWPLLLFSHLDCLYISGLVCLCLNKMELVMTLRLRGVKSTKIILKKLSSRNQVPVCQKMCCKRIRRINIIIIIIIMCGAIFFSFRLHPPKEKGACSELTHRSTNASICTVTWLLSKSVQTSLHRLKLPLI